MTKRNKNKKTAINRIINSHFKNLSHIAIPSDRFISIVGLLNNNQKYNGN
jgi:hypothetical protein